MAKNYKYDNLLENTEMIRVRSSTRHDVMTMKRGVKKFLPTVVAPQ